MKKACFIALCLLCTKLSAQTITSNFNTNTEGWQTFDTPLGTVTGATYRATGGNPSGHISAKDATPLSTMYFVAPAKFLGNKSWAYGNSLSFDLKIETGTFYSEDDVIMEGNGIVLAYDFNNPNTSWTTFTCPLNENAGWRVGNRNGTAATKAQLQNVLCNITKIWIRAEFFSNLFVQDESFLDNVSLGITACAPTINTLPSKTICAGQSVTVNGKTYNQTSIISDTIKRCFPQCDSIIKLNLTVVDAFRVNKDTTICAGNIFKVGSKTYNQTGTYRDTIKRAGSCDSIITLKLTVDTIIPIKKTYKICDIEEVKVLNKIYNQTGVYRDTFRTADSCTNVIISTLIVNPTYITSDNNVEICPNSSYNIGGNTYTQEGRYRVVLKTINGCDSIFYIVIAIKNAITVKVPVKLCEGQTYSINNHIYDRTGIYRDTFRTLQGCDSIVVTDLTINPIYVTVKDTSICQGDFLKIGTKMYNQAGTYRDTLPTITNCDSVFITTLKIFTPLSIARDTSICEGSFIRIGNKNYNQAGVYRDTLKGFRGCDSLIVSINLKTIAPLSIAKDTSICAGNSIRIGTKTYNQTGIYRDTFRRTDGCDSILITNLKIIAPLSILRDTSICQGDFIRIGTKTYNQAGTYRDTVKAKIGCDSLLLTTTLKIIAPLSIVRDTSICQGDFIKIGRKTYDQAGVYRDTLKATKGCDSLYLTTNLKVIIPRSEIRDTIICLGDFVKFGTNTYNRTGVYRDTLKGFKGCDSLIVLTSLLTVGASTINVRTSICKEGAFRFFNKSYNQAGVYSDTLKRLNGCDSLILNLTLSIRPERKGMIDTTICEGKTLTINGKSYKNAGNFNDTIKINGQCDSLLAISIKIKPYPIIKKNVVLCANDSALVNGRVFTKIGIFRDTSTSATACNDITEWTVVKSPLRLNIGTSLVIELGDSIQLNPLVVGTQNDVLWSWTTTTKLTTKDLSCTNCPNPYAKPLQTTIFNLSVKDTATNCTVKDALKVTVKPCESIFVPTAFSPNNDTQNDYFAIFASSCVRKVLSMRVFNRWGVLVFSQRNFLPNNDKNGWDGRMNNQQLPPDVYVYVIELELGDGSKKLVAGDVTLLR
jgi:gliding motility-associated-like protein